MAEGAGLGDSDALRLRVRDLLDDEEAPARAERGAGRPLEFVRAQGARAYDLVGTTSPTLVLVSAHFLDVLRAAGFTGWTTFPVKVTLDDGSSLEGYEGLAISGRCGPIDDSLSELVTLPPAVPGGPEQRALRGLCFRPETWDGSDLFTPSEGYTAAFVTTRVKDEVERAGITNVEFKRLSEIERMWRADGSLL
jgi:hypothetical protein